MTPRRWPRISRASCTARSRAYEAPGLHAFNFLLEDALGGGGMASRRIDPQGKAFGQMALEMKIKVPRALAQNLKPGVFNSNMIRGSA